MSRLLRRARRTRNEASRWPGTARFSPCEYYRYTLTRELRGGNPEQRVVFAMLNPSTATAEVNDPTVRRCIGYAESWGAGALTVVNLFALRSTDPKLLREVDDPIGPDNDAAILGAAQGAWRILCAWGNHGALLRRGARVRALLDEAGYRLHVLGLSKIGEPWHPLYLSKDLQPQPWETP